MATKENHPLTSLAQLADHIKVWTDKCIKKLPSSAISLDDEGDADTNHLVQVGPCPLCQDTHLFESKNPKSK